MIYTKSNIQTIKKRMPPHLLLSENPANVGKNTTHYGGKFTRWLKFVKHYCPVAAIMFELRVRELYNVIVC